MSRTLFVTAATLAFACSAAFAQDLPRAAPGAAGTVTLTRAEYDRLFDLGIRRPSGAEAAPVPAALTRADMRVRVDGTSARATLRVDGEVLRAGIAKVPLLKNATILDARMANRPLPIVAEGGVHVALVAGPGPFSATLQVGAPLAFQPGRASFVLPVPASGSATATLDIPGEQADVHLSSGLILRRASVNGRTVVEATMTPGVPTEIWWSTHESATSSAPARDVRLLSDVKSIVSIGDADVRLISLVNVTVVQGSPAQIAVDLPSGYELVSVSGASLDRTETRVGGVTLFIADSALRRHQFLVSLERPSTLALRGAVDRGGAGAFKLETGLPALPAAQRETGEVAVEGLGTMEIGSPEMPGLRRIDVRELDPSLAAVARQPLLAAYRYQRTIDEPLSLVFDVRRFADAAVLAAVAERAVATTLVTSEGRALTEVTLWLRNRAQSYMKVELPAGASIVSVEVGGVSAKPVEGKDGSRVPLQRPGFRSDGVYAVSFVYLHAGAPFLKKGEMQLTLPKMDVPVNVVEWEMFVPQQFRVDRFDGNAIPAGLVTSHPVILAALPPAQRGQINGRLFDQSGMPLPGATVVVEADGQRRSATTGSDGSYVLSNVPSGNVTLTAQLSGFLTSTQMVQFDQGGQQVDLRLEVAGVSEYVTVTAQSPTLNTQQSQVSGRANDRMQEKKDENEAPSLNVQSLQRRASGVLPVRMEVPRAGTSHRFVKPLVIDEETLVTFRYKKR
jgi:hypothetical protein